MSKLQRVEQRARVRLAADKLRVRDGRLYAPAVIIKPGVLNGLLVEEAELRASAEMWNGRPVTINHPTRNGEVVFSATDEGVWDSHVVGRMMDVRYDQGLRGTMVLERAPMQSVGNSAKRMYRTLRAGSSFEVSTGYWAEIDFSARGKQGGKPYIGVTRSIIPDHVAILPNEQGACSWQDGCGMPRINRKGATMPEEEMVTVTLTNNSGVNSAATVEEPAPDSTAVTNVAAGCACPEANAVTNEDAAEDGAWESWDAWSAEGGVQQEATEGTEVTEATEPVAEVAAPDAPASEEAPPAEMQANAASPAALDALIAELGGAEVVATALRSLVAQRATQRQTHISAIVANSRGQLTAADVEGMPDATLERMARALAPVSYAGAGRPAAPAVETEWVVYSIPEVPEVK